ncbi:MAG: leucine-rich repeat protein, partial [Clostridia bacterium]|nr:leucine-rich repeat protein [Clostridia bacterium]
MKKRIFVSLLAALMILSALTFVSCNSGKGGSSGGNTSSSVKTEKLDMSVEDAVKKVEEAGCKAVVATVYSEDYDDGAVIGIDGFVDGAEKDSYITVAVNDLSIKKQIEDQYLLPLVIEQSRYENEIYNKIKEDKSSESMFSAYYSLLDPSSASDKELASMNNTYPITKNGTAVYVFDTSSSEKEYKMIESIIKEKTSYSYEEMFKDYVSLGIIPTITENTKAHMITADQLKVEDNETGVTVTSYTGNGGVVILPDDVDGKAITEITKGAFPQIDMHSIVLGENMRSVGSSSFPNAYGLFDIKTPAALMNIDANAFSGILFTNTDDNGFKTISGNILLAYTGPEATVAIPDAIEHIGGRAFFQNKAITAVEFPESIISIGTEAFRECSNLGNFTIPGNCIRIGDGAFYKCDPITEINIPDSVIEVGNEAFFECNYAAKITLGSGLKKIGANAFYYNGIKPLEDQSAPHLTEIDIPANVEYIGSEAFYKCLNLSTVNGM